MPRGLETGTTYPDGSTETRAYVTDRDWPTSVTDRLGRTTTWTYDAKGNRLTKTEAAGSPASYRWSWTYNAKGQPLTMTDANGNVTDYIYDAQGYLHQVVEPADAVGGPRATRTFTYDAAGRLSTSSDAEGRTTACVYDARNRVVRIDYADSSHETFSYGAPGSGDENLLVQKTDRNGNVERCTYDTYGRETSCVSAWGTPEAVEKVTTWLEGTTLPRTVTQAGETTLYTYDGFQRRVAVTQSADGGTDLTRATAYDANQRVRSTTDPYGRSTYYAYDINDRVARTVTETAPGSVTLTHDDTTKVGTRDNNDDLLNLTRSPDTLAGANAAYLIKDTAYDAEGQLTSSTDGRGFTTTYAYDAQGRRTETVEAAGTGVAAKTQMDYDDEGNVVEVRMPRYFAPGPGSGPDADPNGSGKSRTTMTYTGRNLLASRTEAPGTAEAATESYTYFLDEREDTTIDPRGNVWSKLWGVCCARIMATIDPPAPGSDGTGSFRGATITRHDFHGNLTHQGRVRDVDNVAFPNVAATGNNSTDLPDAETLNETTTRYDARHRPVAMTVWLVPLGPVDPDNVPIAGGGQAEDPPVTSGGMVQGLTTTYAYDDDLTNGQGIDQTYNATITAELPAGFFATNSDGYAVAITNPEGETTARFVDGTGRTVLSVDPDGDASTMDYDTLVFDGSVGGNGMLLVTAASDPLDHTNKSLTDGAGRTIKTIDAEGFATTYRYDNNSNRVSYRDPNNVGEDCTYDARGRKTVCADTQELANGFFRGYAYDAHSNVIAMTDAKGETSTTVFDARDRQTSTTDRIDATTAFTYDTNLLC